MEENTIERTMLTTPLNPPLPQGDVSGSLQEHKEVIRELMNTYIINLNEDGEPKASITDIMKLIDRAVALVGNDR